MSHFVVENKKRLVPLPHNSVFFFSKIFHLLQLKSLSSEHAEWNQISNNVKPDNNYVVLDLEPATWYNLRITAHNSAGFTVAEYDFATLTVTGGIYFLFSDLHLYICVYLNIYIQIFT